MSQNSEYPVADVKAGLPARARNLLDAAHRILLQEGYDGLTWNRISREAGEQKSTIAYYFGDKSTLMLTLLRVMGQNAAERLVARCEALPEGADRLRTYISGLRALHESPDSIAFYDILPHALRDERMRSEVADLYDWYRRMSLRVFGVDAITQPEAPGVQADGEATGCDCGAAHPESGEDVDATRFDAVAWLFMAAIDGILIQEALNPTNYDPGAVYRGLERALLLLLDACERDGEALSG